MGSESQAFHYRHVLAENAANKNAPTGVKIAIKYNGISSFLLYRLTTICSHPLVRRANDNYYHSFSFCLCIYGRITECYVPHPRYVSHHARIHRAPTRNFWQNDLDINSGLSGRRPGIEHYNSHHPTQLPDCLRVHEKWKSGHHPKRSIITMSGDRDLERSVLSDNLFQDSI
jgi:hypothetical protein